MILCRRPVPHHAARPVDRVISEHYYRLYKGLQGAQGHVPLITVSEQMKVGHQDNLQVRMISGQGAMGEVTQATLEQASENLFTPSMTFGLVDRFTESLLLFSAKFGWQGLPIGLNFNRTPHKNEHSVDSQTRRALAEHHSFDVQLVDLLPLHFAMRLCDAEITPTEVAKFSNHWTTKARTFSFLSASGSQTFFPNDQRCLEPSTMTTHPATLIFLHIPKTAVLQPTADHCETVSRRGDLSILSVRKTSHARSTPPNSTRRHPLDEFP